MQAETSYMREAIELALKAWGMTSPNPLVGAVIVKDGKVTGRGFHEQAGKAHAEINALAESGRTAQKADLYVTLEPCSTFGRTPPCADAIIRAESDGSLSALWTRIPPMPGAAWISSKMPGLRFLRGWKKIHATLSTKPSLSGSPPERRLSS